ncbi:STAS domain-containing protein [Salinigranum marinum]|uniref:STAS domain-containing protein n=1 Tax=Salinigranum marinum TaxID=1515595 RepID=UPI002989E1E8|nr:STAS domain-containing protein [Salinigranum marinum]
MTRLFRVSKSDFTVAVGSLVGVMAVGLLWGVFIGVFVSLLVTIERISDPKIVALGRVPGTDHFVDQGRHGEVEDVPAVVVYRVEAQLFYANASRVRETILARVDGSTRPVDLVVLDLISSPTVDLEAIGMLESLHAGLASRGVDFRLAGADAQVRRLLRRSGLEETVGTVGEEDAISTVIERWWSEAAETD